MTMITNIAKIQPRSIHISTYPATRTLIESKLVLAALQKFGEVVTFRSLRYDTTNTSSNKIGTTVVIFESEISASNAVLSSPLLIPLPGSDPSIIPDRAHSPNTATTSTTTTTTPHQNPTRTDDNPTPKPRPTHLTCYIDMSRHNHESALRRNPFFTQFEVDEESAVSKDLIATGIDLPVLADVPAGRKGFLPMRQRKGTHIATTKLGGGSLMTLYRAGVANAERRAKKEAKEAEKAGEDGEEGGKGKDNDG
ncbi:hypothetical protein BDW59DRAFT_176635 [Aspergillus cavernicola]|uniref:RRM domain-containing protein n=1 Tax=Aspergillus cavernicola TaxID=176166 RepID=A0ABR4HE80_9EURO